MTGANSSASAPPTQPSSGTPRRCGLATASLVCGILGPCTAGLAAVAGLILGIVALSRIAKSAGQLTGRGLAIAGITLSAATPVLLAIVAMLVAILLPALARVQTKVETLRSIRDVQRVCDGAFAFAAANDNTLPPPDTWPEELQRYVPNLDEALRDPGNRESGRAYAMNSRVASLRRSLIHRPQETVLYFECRLGASSAGGPELFPDRPRRRDHYMVGFCDGHVEHVHKDQVHRLVWDPMGE